MEASAVHAGQTVLTEPHLVVITLLHVNIEASSVEKHQTFCLLPCWSPDILFHFVVFIKEEGNLGTLIKNEAHG